MISLDEVRSALSRNAPRRYPAPRAVADRAAVAIALAGPAEALSACFILRAQRDDDHWSGQMAFPGGRAQEGDGSSRATAEREAREEVNLDLSGAELLGELSQVRLRHRGYDTEGVVTPCVYYCGAALPELHPNPEVAAAYWIPIPHLWDDAQQMFFEFEFNDEPFKLPGIRWGEQVIWGLTHRILVMFAAVLGRPLPGAEAYPPDE